MPASFKCDAKINNSRDDGALDDGPLLGGLEELCAMQAGHSASLQRDSSCRRSCAGGENHAGIPGFGSVSGMHLGNFIR